MRVKSNIPQVADQYFAGLFQRAEQATIRAMQKTALRGEARARAIIVQEAYDTGDLLRSVTHEIKVLPDAVMMALFAAAAHGIVVEEGRKPGRFPNLDDLSKWIGRKLRSQGINTRVTLSFNQLKALAKTNGQPATAQQKAYRQHLSALYLIGRAIATKGIREKLIFKRLQGELLAFFRAELARELSSLR